MSLAGRLTGATLVVIGALTAAAPGGAPAASRPPARLLVYAQEWSLWPSRVSVAAGPVAVQLWNRGQDPHDLRIRRLRHGRPSGRAQGVATTVPGRIADGTWHLGPGTYELYCSLAGHAHAGMHTRLTVR